MDLLFLLLIICHDHDIKFDIIEGPRNQISLCPQSFILYKYTARLVQSFNKTSHYDSYL